MSKSFPNTPTLKRNAAKLMQDFIQIIEDFLQSITAFGWVIVFVIFGTPIFIWLWSKWHSRFDNIKKFEEWRDGINNSWTEEKLGI